MEKINLHNYEAYFLDFIEKNLTPIQEQELNDFLMEYPELKSELNEFQLITLKEGISENKALKNSLLKDEATGLGRSEYLMIAQAEEVITAEEKAELSALIKTDESLLTDLSLYHKTRLKKEELLFPGKSNLLQKEKSVFVWWSYAAAACILALLLFNLNFNDQVYNPRKFSYQESPSETNKLQYAGIIVKEELEAIAVESKQVVSTKKVKKLTPSNTAIAQTIEANKNEKEIQHLEDRKQQELDVIDNENSLAEVEKPTINNPEKVDEAQEASKENLPELVLNEMDSDELADVSNDFIPIQKFAKDKYKKEVLKGKTFTETVLEEIEEVTNKKVSFESKKDSKGNTEQFAINIGKFSFSRNK